MKKTANISTFILIVAFLGIFSPVKFSYAGYTDDLIPTMTGYTAPSGEISEDSHDTTLYAWKAADNNTSTYWYSAVSSPPHYVGYDFGEGVSKTITKYTILPFSGTAYLPLSFKLQGSNNSSTWYNLDTQTDLTTGWETGVYRPFIFSNSTAYRYYKLNISKSSGDNLEVSIKEFELMETAVVNPTLISIDPGSVYNNANLSITEIVGTGFAEGISVKLKKAGEDDLTCSGFSVASSISITGGNCPTNGVSVGNWDLYVQNTDTGHATLVSAVAVSAPPAGGGNNYTSQTNRAVEGTSFDNDWIQDLNATSTSTFIADDITSVKVRLKVHRTNPNQNLRLKILSHHYGSHNNASPESLYFYVDMATTTIQNDVWADYTFATSTPIVQTNDQRNYFILIQSDYGGLAVAGASTNLYTKGALYNGDGLSAAPDPVDLYFRFNSVPAQDSISIFYPANGSTELQNFSHYRFIFTTAGSTDTTNFGINIKVASTSQPFTNYDYGYLGTFTTTEPSSIKTWSLDNPAVNGTADPFVPEATYYVGAELYNMDTGQITASSSVISFTMSATFSINYILNTAGNIITISTTTPPTSTSTALVITCDESSGFFAVSFCKLFKYLFEPDKNVLNNWAILKSELASKPPFGYFTAYQSAINGLTTATTTSAVQLADLSALEISFFNPLKLILTMLIWFLFTWSTFTRLKHLQL